MLKIHCYFTSVDGTNLNMSFSRFIKKHLFVTFNDPVRESWGFIMEVQGISNF